MIQHTIQRTGVLLRLPRVALWGALLAVSVGTFATLSYAGNLTPPGPPAKTMYTLTDIYNLASGTMAPWTPGTTVLTGQDTCYNAAGTSISCASTGQDGETQAGLPFSYTDNGDDTVTDNNTGLIWQQSTTTTMTWEAALTYCNNNTPGLPGSGWRLPNVKELFTLVDFGISSTAKIDLTYFPGTPAGSFWSATTYPLSGFQGNAMFVSFNNGGVYSNGKSSSGYVRCVRE